MEDPDPYRRSFFRITRRLQCLQTMSLRRPVKSRRATTIKPRLRLRLMVFEDGLGPEWWMLTNNFSEKSGSTMRNRYRLGFTKHFWVIFGGISIIHELRFQFLTNLYGKHRGLTWFNHRKWEYFVDIMGYMTKNVFENGGFCPPFFDKPRRFVVG